MLRLTAEAHVAGQAVHLPITHTQGRPGLIGPAFLSLRYDVQPAAAAPVHNPIEQTFRSRRFHHAVGGDVDEGELQTWWRALDDPLLERLILEALEQNIELCEASKRVRQSLRTAPTDLAEAATAPVCAAAWTTYHQRRVQLIAAVAASYFSVISLQEREQCASVSIALHRSMLRPESSTGPAENLQVLDMHRARLRAEACVARARLARLCCTPLDVLTTRLDKCWLPPTPAELPPCGSPERLHARRPDLLAIHLQQNASEDDRSCELHAEKLWLTAIAEVECALAILAGVIEETRPARAAALAAGTRAREALDAIVLGSGSIEVALRLDREFHARCDREIETRARSYIAWARLYEALGAGWPAPIDEASQ